MYKSRTIRFLFGKNITTIDFKNGKFSYGQRIELGRIFNSGNSEHKIFIEVFKCLHDVNLNRFQYKVVLEYFKYICDELTIWVEKESKLLHYEPTQDEINAGIKTLSQKLGELSTINSLAKQFSADPQTILDWDYGKVFGILYSDLENFNYQKKYNEIISKKK